MKLAIMVLSCYIFSLLIIMASLSIGSLNVNGCRSVRKRFALFNFLTLKKTGVIFLQETHTDKYNQPEWLSEWKGQVFLNHGSNVSAGVAILISAKLQGQDFSMIDIIPGRMQQVDIILQGLSFSFINVYAPNVGFDRIECFRKLQEVIKGIPQERVIIVAGDFNCTVNHTVDRNHDEPHPKSSEALRNVLKYHALVDVWRESFPKEKQYTWLKMSSKIISGARLDRIYVQKTKRQYFRNSSISPTPLSDHHYISVTVTTLNTHNKSYWHFNNRLLKDHSFVHSFTLFWRAWRERMSQFKSLSQWWDIGKIQMKSFCQQYTQNNTNETKKKIKRLEDDILKLSSSISGEDGESEDLLEQNKFILKNLYEERDQGAIVRAKIAQLHNMDTSSKFFFALERKVRERKSIDHLKLPDGRETTDKKEIILQALSFYENLYSAQSCDPKAVERILNDVPKLSDDNKKELELSLSFEELSTACEQQSAGRSPGLDGLTSEFYRVFWSLIGPDLHSVFTESEKLKVLPLSCRRAVITLLPKKGDLRSLKNWRPISILNTDYKILSKALTNRLKECLASIVHEDQSYCVPKRSIFDNLFLVRDLLQLTDIHKLDVGLLSLDQEKAFDRVDHHYLFKTLTAFGFGEKFISQVQLLYTDVYSMLKINGVLTRTFPVCRGVRQGCSLSGLLYTLSIEPLLRLLRKNLHGISVLNPDISEVTTVSLTAYADDITVIIRSQEDIEHLNMSLDLYQEASSAQVNWNKTNALLLGHWQEESPPHLSQMCQWKTDGFKILGVFFGTDQYMTKNWDGIAEKVLGKLQKWKWIQPQLSYRGRVLVINNLAASMLWHRLSVLDPPTDLLQLLQKHFVDFFWGGYHWLNSGVLCLPVFEGGQSLIHLVSKVKAMRLQIAQRLLYDRNPQPWIMFSLAILRNTGGKGLDRQLFLMSNEMFKNVSFTSFHKNVLSVWNQFKTDREEHFGLDEPLFYNSWFCQKDMSDTEIKNFVSGGISKVEDLIDLEERKWNSVQEICRQVGGKSERIVGNILNKLKESFPVLLRQFIERFLSTGLKQCLFPEVFITPHSYQDVKEERPLLSFRELEHESFLEINKKQLYIVCVKITFSKQLIEKKDTKWRSFLSVSQEQVPSWRLFYKSPLPKRSGDLQWRILHCAMPTKTFLFKCNSEILPVCSFCNVLETIFHTFCECQRLCALFSFLEGMLSSLGWVFSKTIFIFGCKYSCSQRENCTLSNFLIGQAKLSIWKAYKIENEGKTINILALFKALVKSRIKLEYEYYKMNDDMLSFGMKWCLSTNLFSLEDGELLFPW